MRLNEDLIIEVTGEEGLELIEEIEIIFNLVDEIGGLDRCKSLRSLNLLKTPLRVISNLSPVSHCLNRLCIQDCSISKIENLCLPNLKQLILHDNSITKIENLEGCPKLEKLWLSSNKIAKLENLQCLPDLRELMIQDNKISKIQNLESLSNLETLGLAGNKISEYKDILSLGHLPLLSNLSLEDTTFGPRCPIIEQDGYLTFTLCHLKYLTQLDGKEVTPKSKVLAEEHYLKKVMEFNDEIDLVCRENERQLLSVEAQRQRNIAVATEIKQEVLEAFKGLENAVIYGRKRIEKEQQRQIDLRSSNMEAFQSSVHSLKTEYDDKINAMKSTEEVQYQNKEKVLNILKSRILAERNLSIFISSLQLEPNIDVIAQEIAPHTPDYRLLKHNFTNSMQDESYDASTITTATTSSDSKNDKKHKSNKSSQRMKYNTVSLVKVFRILNSAANTVFQEEISSISEPFRNSTASLREAPTLPSASQPIASLSVRDMQYLYMMSTSSPISTTTTTTTSSSDDGSSNKSSLYDIVKYGFSNNSNDTRTTSTEAEKDVSDAITHLDYELLWQSPAAAYTVHNLFHNHTSTATATATSNAKFQEMLILRTAMLSNCVDLTAEDLDIPNIPSFIAKHTNNNSNNDNNNNQEGEINNHCYNKFTQNIINLFQDKNSDNRFQIGKIQINGYTAYLMSRKALKLAVPDFIVLTIGGLDNTISNNTTSPLREVATMDQQNPVKSPTQHGNNVLHHEDLIDLMIEPIALEKYCSDLLTVSSSQDYNLDKNGSIDIDNNKIHDDEDYLQQLCHLFNTQLQEEVMLFEERVHQEMDPVTARRLREVDAEVQRLEATRDSLRDQINAEKMEQENILREFRHNMIGKTRTGKNLSRY